MSDHTDYKRVLAIETATPVQALALLDGENLREHRVQHVRYNHGSSLLQNVDQLLSARKIELPDIDLFAVGLGPGSFTGLRVGLATAKALARSVKKPIVGISSLAALAYAAARINPGATVLTAIDARRREIFGAAYRWTPEGLVSIIDDCAVDPAEFRERVEAELEGPIVLVGDGQSKYPALRQWKHPNLTIVPPDLATPSAIGVARLSRRAAQADGPADLIALEPNYIRPSDAVLPDKPPGPMPPAPDQRDN